MTTKIPKYRRQKRNNSTDIAFVELNGQRHYLGQYGTPQSKQKYHSLMAQWQEAGGQLPVNARDRIGPGPWYNAKGVLIAANVADLHGDYERDRNNIRKPTALTEKGAEVRGVGDKPNEHDILTGSDSHGRTPIGAANVLTCNNWTSSDNADRAIVGHHDRLGGANTSWNAVHSSGGCSQEALVKTGGAGFFYCFAAQ